MRANASVVAAGGAGGEPEVEAAPPERRVGRRAAQWDRVRSAASPRVARGVSSGFAESTRAAAPVAYGVDSEVPQNGLRSDVVVQSAATRSGLIRSSVRRAAGAVGLDDVGRVEGRPPRPRSCPGSRCRPGSAACWPRSGTGARNRRDVSTSSCRRDATGPAGVRHDDPVRARRRGREAEALDRIAAAVLRCPPMRRRASDALDP